MKKTKRKGFNFLRSYFDVMNKLEKDEDKLKFLEAIINKSFLNEEPKDLNFLVDLCYESQRHAVEKSVKGWIVANKTDLQGSPEPPPKGNPPIPPKEGQGQGEDEEQVKGEVEDELYKSIDTLAEVYLNNEEIVKAVLSNDKFPINSENHLKEKMNEFLIQLKSTGETTKQRKDFNKHFMNWAKVVRKSEEKPERFRLQMDDLEITESDRNQTIDIKEYLKIGQ